MDTLNIVIAEKILEISTADNSDVKIKLQKINRFRDFVNACQSLIKKYPEIEKELLLMVHDNDFDARIASTRVDSIIRLYENQTITNTVTNVEEDIHQLEDIIENLPNKSQSSFSDKSKNNQEQSIVNTEKATVATAPDSKNLNIESGEKVKSLPEAEIIDEEKENQYVDFEEISDTNLTEVDNVVNYSKENPTIFLNDKKNITTTKKILWIIAIVISVVVLWIVIKFIINHWSTILWILGVCAFLTFLFWYLFRRKKEEI